MMMTNATCGGAQSRASAGHDVFQDDNASPTDKEGPTYKSPTRHLIGLLIEAPQDFQTGEKRKPMLSRTCRPGEQPPTNNHGAIKTFEALKEDGNMTTTLIFRQDNAPPRDKKGPNLKAPLGHWIDLSIRKASKFWKERKKRTNVKIQEINFD
ncbi:unnamed protein product [Caenorhabditis nigoni]